MKKKKRLLGILLSLVMVLGLLPGITITAYAWEASNISLSEITTNKSGDVTGFYLSYEITGSGIGSQAKSMIGVQTEPFKQSLTAEEAATIPWDPDNTEALNKFHNDEKYNSFMTAEVRRRYLGFKKGKDFQLKTMADGQTHVILGVYKVKANAEKRAAQLLDKYNLQTTLIEI